MTQQVEGGSQNTTTLEGLRGGTSYNITIRAYQDLLGPASSPISVQTSGIISLFNTYIIICIVISSINWTLVSSITKLNNTQYRIDCHIIVQNVDVHWLVNGTIKYSSISTNYNYSLLVYPDPLGGSVNVTCIAMNGGFNYSDTVILQGMSLNYLLIVIFV